MKGPHIIPKSPTCARNCARHWQHGHHIVLLALVITQPNCVPLCMLGIGEDTETVEPGLVGKVDFYWVIAPFCRWRILCKKQDLEKKSNK